MTTINRYVLEHEKTFDYFVSHINSGKTLSQKILKNIHFENGAFFVLLEGEALLDELYEFEGSLPILDSLDEEDTEFFQWSIEDFVKDFLKKSPNNVAVMDQFIVERANFQCEGVDVAFFNEEVHYLVHSDAPSNSILKSIGRADIMWHLLVVLISGLKLPNRNKLEEKDFDTVCENAQYIMTTCYDGEGYLFWERNPR